MLRKHINLLSDDVVSNDKFPFYAWECITIQMKNRDLDLIIRNDKNMREFVHYLLSKLNSIDGTKNSAQAPLYASIVQFKNQ